MASPSVKSSYRCLHEESEERKDTNVSITSFSNPIKYVLNAGDHTLLLVHVRFGKEINYAHAWYGFITFDKINMAQGAEMHSLISDTLQ